ncbi:MAG: 2,3-bisphosphoglycerate-independent phosphoglycerate mutase, partial [Verrucomicrobiales bacterium]
MKKPLVLIIRDGWAENPGGLAAAEANGDATLLAKTPFHEGLYAKYPQSRLSASGEDVGLPDGQMGNSEVGHLNLGAGRIVYQDLTRISLAIREGILGQNEVLKDAFEKASATRLHLWGLVSDGGVHSHLDHLVALAEEARKQGVQHILAHLITDGRDTSPTGGARYLESILGKLHSLGVKTPTVVGRYYAMDRDKRWERTELAWNAMVHGQGRESGDDLVAAVKQCYAENITDEFLPAMVFGPKEERGIRDNDVVLCFNFRSDRARQLTQPFLDVKFDDFDRGKCPQVHYYCLTRYDKTYDVPVVFLPQSLAKILSEVVSSAGLTQLRMAETEKYPHVTYFFNGGIEAPFPGEDREIIPSPKVATYDLQPEMSAQQVMETALRLLPEYDLIILNFANPDMVGHTGDLQAAIKAVETIDAGVKAVVEKALELGGRCLVTADHGNCEQMIDPQTGGPHTAHTTYDVPLIVVEPSLAGSKLREGGRLADIAPTLLELMGLPIPEEMT